MIDVIPLHDIYYFFHFLKSYFIAMQQLSYSDKFTPYYCDLLEKLMCYISVRRLCDQFKNQSYSSINQRTTESATITFAQTIRVTGFFTITPHVYSTICVRVISRKSYLCYVFARFLRISCNLILVLEVYQFHSLKLSHLVVVCKHNFVEKISNDAVGV